MKIPADMQAELGAWNDGRGVSLDTWTACSGNLKFAVGYSGIFWPRFKLEGDYIVRDYVTAESVAAFEAQWGKGSSGIEATLNHLHIADIQAVGDADTTLERIRFLLPVFKEIYSAKLAWEFPERPCRVCTYEPVDALDLVEYQITFWQKKFEV